MTTQMIIAQCLMVLTLVIMITGMTPIYITAITGAAISGNCRRLPACRKRSDDNCKDD